MSNINDQLMTPDVWGPHGWKFIHYITLGYPEYPTQMQKDKYKAFFLLLKDVLPCSLCANHYKENLQKYPISEQILNSRDKFIKWGIDIHNSVNKLNKKPELDYITAYNLINKESECKLDKKIESFNTIKKKEDKIENKKSIKYENIDDTIMVYKLLGLFAVLISIAFIYKKY